MTVQETPAGLLITRLPWEEMALLAHALPLTPSVRQVLDALWAGRRVAVSADAYEYRTFRHTAPAGVYRKFVAMERQLREMGLVRARKGEVP